MNELESVNTLIEIIKESALKFGTSLNSNLKYYFKEEKNDNEVIIYFNMMYGRELEYMIVLKRQKIELDYIPDVQGYEKLDLVTNPYKSLTYTDENVILGNIYDLIQNIDKAEIACYEKLGIIIRNPLQLKGLYGINIKYITD